MTDRLSLSGNSVLSMEFPLFSVYLWFASVIGLALLLRIKKRRIKMIASTFSVFSLFMSIFFFNLTPETKSERIRFKHSFTKMEVEYLTDTKVNKLGVV